MTSPVINTADSNNNIDSYEIMQFILPSIYPTIDSAPVPQNSEVTIVQVPQKFLACNTFSGVGSYSQLKNYAMDLQKLIDYLCETETDVYRKVCSTDNSWEGHYYNSTWVLPRFRRNDVCIPVDVEYDYNNFAR